MCACAVCTAKGTLSQLHCAITKLETCKKLFFICTVHITRLCVNRDCVFSTHRTIACRDMYCVPLMLFVYIVCICCLLIVYHTCILFSTSTDHETRLVVCLCYISVHS